VVASASYEARKVGIRSAMPMSTAVRLCPGLKIMPANWPNASGNARAGDGHSGKEYGPVEQVSVDEAYVDLSDTADPLSLEKADTNGR
jgi:DNA polymerase IV